MHSQVAGEALWNRWRKVRETATEEVNFGVFDDHCKSHLREGVTNKGAAIHRTRRIRGGVHFLCGFQMQKQWRGVLVVQKELNK